MILLDTNILLCAAQSNSPFFEEVTNKILHLAKEEELVLCPQNFYEFYAVATRPISANGFGLSPQEAIEQLKRLQEAYVVLPESDLVFQHWQALLTRYNIQGKSTHDAKIAAFMIAHGIRKLYTLNKKDFQRYRDWLTFV